MFDSKIIKASFKDCALEDRRNFIHSKCLMPISVGQKIHEGEKFAAAVNLINRSFNSCTILVDDTIQRHTMKIEKNENHDVLFARALEEGDVWLKRNGNVINSINIPHQVIRWNRWLDDPDYPALLKKIEQTYSQNEEFKNAVDNNIHTFLKRYRIRINKHIDYENSFSCCLDYLMEECACMCLWPKEGFHFEVYPTGRNEAMNKTYELFIKPSMPNLLKSVSLRFKKYSKQNTNELIEA